MVLIFLSFFRPWSFAIVGCQIDKCLLLSGKWCIPISSVVIIFNSLSWYHITTFATIIFIITIISSWYWCISMYNACLQIIVLSIAATHREHRQTTKVVVIIIVIAIFSTVTIISIMMVVMMMMVMMIIWTRWWAGRVRSSLLGQMQFPSLCRRRYKLWLDYQMSPFPDFNFSHTWLWIPLNKYLQRRGGTAL